MPDTLTSPPPEPRSPQALRAIRRLVDETVTVTGSPPPDSLDVNAPTLDDSTLAAAPDESLYLVGLIGGKNVGKSSLVNALVGQPVSAGTSHGPGTEKVIAYVHASQADGLRQLLDREVPGRYEIITHALPHLVRQALLDLPDFDSHYEDHCEVTRRMLRHMLYPVWLQSIEKYADRQARELLLRVTAGNAPRNFIFALNKVDQLVAREGPQACAELREDYAGRLGRALQLDPPPRVWMLSAVQPDAHDLPALRELIGHQKSVETVAMSRQLALRQQGNSLLAWFDRQQLPEHLDRLNRLEEQAREEVLDQIAGPVIERIVPALQEDRAVRAALADEVMQKRIMRWPIVNILHVLLDAVISALRLRLPYGQHWVFEGADTLVARHFETGRVSLAARIQTVFARLQQSHPMVSRLYADRRFWDDRAAEEAAEELRRHLSAAIEHQRREALGALTHGWGPLGWTVRFVLTIGAALWFPLIQPVLEATLRGSPMTLALLVVQVLGVNYLLKNVGFLCVYFVLLWLYLKWRTRHQVERWFDRWKQGDPLNPEQSLTGQVLEWSRRLSDPVRQMRERLDSLLRQAQALKIAVSDTRVAAD